MTAALEVSDLHVWFEQPEAKDTHAVDGVSLRVEAGERFGLVGESGCGKTTTLLASMGLLPPNARVAGTVKVDGKDVLHAGEESAREARWREIAIVFQGAMNAFNPVRTIGAQVGEAVRRTPGFPNDQVSERTDELLGEVGLRSDVARRYPHQLSGGMRQRAMIAMALACEPSVLLADEPTTALDVMVQAQILALLERLADSREMAVVFVTHDLAVVAQLCERAAVMYAGEVAESGSLDTLYHGAQHPYTRRLFAATPELDATERSHSIPGVPPRLDDTLVGCRFCDRCTEVTDLCRVDRPELRTISSGHQAACHYATGRVPQGVEA